MSKTISVEITINASLDEVWNEVSKIENHSNLFLKLELVFMEKDGKSFRQ